ncbi:unnamed protein product, partial [Polarella glacialis]
ARPQSVRRVPFVEYGCSKKGNGLPRCAIWSLGLACVGRRSSSGGRKWGRLHREAWTAQQPSQDSRRSALHREIVHDDWEGFLASLGNGECAATSLAVLCGVSSGGDLGAVLRPCALLGLTCVVVIGGLNRGAVDRALWSSQLRRRSSEWSLSLSLAPKELSVAASLSQLKAALGGANLWDFERFLSEVLAEKMRLKRTKEWSGEAAVHPGGFATPERQGLTSSFRLRAEAPAGYGEMYTDDDKYAECARNPRKASRALEASSALEVLQWPPRCAVPWHSSLVEVAPSTSSCEDGAAVQTLVPCDDISTAEVVANGTSLEDEVIEETAQQVLDRVWFFASETGGETTEELMDIMRKTLEMGLRDGSLEKVLAASQANASEAEMRTMMATRLEAALKDGSLEKVLLETKSAKLKDQADVVAEELVSDLLEQVVGNGIDMYLAAEDYGFSDDADSVCFMDVDDDDLDAYV